MILLLTLQRLISQCWDQWSFRLLYKVQTGELFIQSQHQLNIKLLIILYSLLYYTPYSNHWHLFQDCSVMPENVTPFLAQILFLFLFSSVMNTWTIGSCKGLLASPAVETNAMIQLRRNSLIQLKKCDKANHLTGFWCLRVEVIDHGWQSMDSSDPEASRRERETDCNWNGVKPDGREILCC